MTTPYRQALSRRLIPVVTIDAAEDAEPLAEALIAGELPVAEITLRSSAALEAITTMAQRGNVIVGAGTVLTTDQVRQATDAGAQFIVSPGFNPELVQYCQNLKIPVLPGVSTPTDIQLSLAHGLDTVKFFPAEAFGGTQTLAAVSGPFPAMRFVPTGGITNENLLRYLRMPQVAACGGSWIVDRELIASGSFDVIRQRIVEALAIVAKAEEKTP
jgi:2-dehydro-3-deoxyphosphogluconate aldolase/(4S)-4-hydroxy-2-oxoglutarate aldolase